MTKYLIVWNNESVTEKDVIDGRDEAVRFANAIRDTGNEGRNVKLVATYQLHEVDLR